jgi:hypothetical protein
MDGGHNRLDALALHSPLRTTGSNQALETIIVHLYDPTNGSAISEFMGHAETVSCLPMGDALRQDLSEGTTVRLCDVTPSSLNSPFCTFCSMSRFLSQWPDDILHQDHWTLWDPTNKWCSHRATD